MTRQDVSVIGFSGNVPRFCFRAREAVKNKSPSRSVGQDPALKSTPNTSLVRRNDVIEMSMVDEYPQCDWLLFRF